jgi:hypothetical protein
MSERLNALLRLAQNQPTIKKAAFPNGSYQVMTTDRSGRI